MTGDKVSLAKALAAAQEHALQPAPAMSLFGDGKQLLERIKLLVGESKEPNTSQRNSAIALLTVVICSIALLAFTNFGKMPFNVSELTGGKNAIDMLQLGTSVNEIKDLLDGIVSTDQNKLNSNNQAGNKNALPDLPQNFDPKITERYAESLKSLGINAEDLNRQMNMYNKYMQNSKVLNDNLMLDLQSLSNMQNMDLEFDMKDFQKEMKQMNKTIKELKEKIRGQSQKK
jgi:hypothetical protein